MAADRQAAAGAEVVAVASKRNWVVRLLASIPTLWWIVAAAALALGASALFGGLDDADSVGEVTTPVIDVGEEFPAEQFTTTVTGARLYDVFPTEFSEPEGEGNRFLVVTAIVTNNYYQSIFGPETLLRLEFLGEEGQESVRHVLMSDLSGSPQTDPRIPQEIGFVWEVANDAFVDGDTIRVSITSQTLFTENSVTYGDYWVDPVVTAWVDVTVEDRG